MPKQSIYEYRLTILPNIKGKETSNKVRPKNNE